MEFLEFTPQDLPLNIKSQLINMGLYILGAFIAASWIFVIYGVLTCPEIKEDERPVRNNRPSKHGLHEGQGRQD